MDTDLSDVIAGLIEEIRKLKEKVLQLEENEKNHFSKITVDGDLNVDGGVAIGSLTYDPPANNLIILNQDNESASVGLRFTSDIANIRYGGSGAGSAGGLQVQGTSDAVKLQVDNDGGLRVAGGQYVGAIDVDPADDRLTVEAETNLTNTTICTLQSRHNTSGTVAAGFGSYMLFQAESSTTEDQNQAVIEAQWDDHTHASRKGRLLLQVYDTSATPRLGIRIETDGSNPELGFFGAAPVTRPTVTGSRGGNAALASLLTAMANLGLITNSTSA